jgi:hypothetical protein
LQVKRFDVGECTDDDGVLDVDVQRYPFFDRNTFDDGGSFSGNEKVVLLEKTETLNFWFHWAGIIK